MSGNPYIKEHAADALPNPILPQPEVAIHGDVTAETKSVIAQAVAAEIANVHSHYTECGIVFPDVKPSALKVEIYDDQNYRLFSDGPNNWKFNYLLGVKNRESILINASLIGLFPDLWLTMVNHEIRHVYIARGVGIDTFLLSFPLKEGVAGLAIDSTSRLKQIFADGKDKLIPTLSIHSWDLEFDKAETDRRCFVDSPYYLGMFSFFHDYVGINLGLLSKLVGLYPQLKDNPRSLTEIWRQTYPELPSLETLQDDWLRVNDFQRYV